MLKTRSHATFGGAIFRHQMNASMDGGQKCPSCSQKRDGRCSSFLSTGEQGQVVLMVQGVHQR